MANCINKNMPGYQTLKERSGVSDVLFNAICGVYLDKYGRLPNLDEIPGSNSRSFISKGIQLRHDNSAAIDNILEFTGANTIEEANIKLNNTYTDQEITIVPIVKDALVDITKRPTEQSLVQSEMQSFSPNKHNYLNKVVNKLSELYGIDITTITDVELNSPGWKNLIPDDKLVSAFIYNGKIYINTDRASLDSPIHEMMHMLVGSIRFTNPSLYQKLVSSVERFSNYPGLLSQYEGKSRNDANEEIFISEVAKYLTGQSSEIKNLGEANLYEINYGIKRVLDTILMGETSVKTIDNFSLFNMPLKTLAEVVRSSYTINTYRGAYNDPTLHRILNNRKEELIKQGLLEEHCE